VWLFFALGSAFFAGIIVVFAKLGIHGHDSALMLREHVSGRYLLGIAGMCAGAVLMVIG